MQLLETCHQTSIQPSADRHMAHQEVRKEGGREREEVVFLGFHSG